MKVNAAFVIVLAMAIDTLGVCGDLFGKETDLSAAQILQDRSLERKTWTSTPQELHLLENEIVRQIQEHPYKAFYFYLLSHIKLRMFANAPQDLALIKLASEMAQQAIELSPEEDYGYIALAETLDLMGQSDRGVTLLETAASSNILPTWRYYFTLARLSTQRSSQEKVLALLEQALAFKGSQPEIIVPYVVAVLQTSHDAEELLTELFAWDAKFPNPLFKQTVAIELSNQGKFEQAHAIYKSIYRNGDHRESKVNDAILLYSNMNRAKEAIKSFQDVLSDKDLETIDTELAVVIHSHLGAALLADRKPEQAQEHFVKAVKLAQDKLAIIDFASKSYRKQNQAKRLAGFIERLTLETKPTGVLYAILGETQSEDLDRHDDALRSFSNAILLDPSRSDFYNGMGLTYYRMDQNEKALSLFQEATKVDPNDATAMYNGACVLSKLGRINESLGALQEALALDPRLADHARTDKDFANIATRPEFNQLLDGTTLSLEGHEPDNVQDRLPYEDEGLPISH